MKCEIEFRPASEMPPTPKGKLRDYLVVIENSRGDVRVHAATHTHDWPMFASDDGDPICDECPDDGSHDEGCPETMWCLYLDLDAENFFPLLHPGDTLIAWAPMPDYRPEGDA